MQQKEQTLKEWAKKVSEEWKHVPSMKGKQAIPRLATLRILATSKTPRSCWDLSLEYLEKTEPKFAYWDQNKKYHERMKENASMNRRLKALERDKYIIKLGSVYKLSAKGIFVLLAADSDIINHVSNSFLEEDTPDLPPELAQQMGSILPKDETVQANVWQQLKNIVGGDPLTRQNCSFIIKGLLQSYKVNLDAISTAELFQLLHDALMKRYSKL
jgi:hypothetical protein